MANSIPRSVAFWLVLFALTARPCAAETPVAFNRDVRPILSDACFQCHGPDKAKRKANLRLDTQTDLYASRDGHKIVAPGEPEKSELFLRITSTEESERMPPHTIGRRLSTSQIDTIRRWIKQGAQWQKHWAFLPPQRPLLPAVKNSAWPRNGIDHFVLAMLEAKGLSPAPEADKVTLLRRVTFDLTGLPPTPAEVDGFLADSSPRAYEFAVNRLLQSPRYGERMAVPWLDAARYADTHGYQTDGERIMWRWRDWVIDAYNRNLAFDRFTIEQIAGDLLPGATLEQKLATGFNRNHRGNSEGGIVPEEYSVEYVADRVETTATVWLGLTLGCCRCHDHKFDPFSQKEFYQLFAYFNNVPEHGRAVKNGNSPPYLRTPTSEMVRQLRALDQHIASATKTLARLEPQIATAQSQWEKSLTTAPPLSWAPRANLVARFTLDGNVEDDAPGGPVAGAEGGAARFAPGKLGQALDLDGKRFLLADRANFGYEDRFTLAAWVLPRKRDGAILSRMTDEPKGLGYNLILVNGRVQFQMTARWFDDAMRIESERILEPGRWHHVCATYDASRVAQGMRLYIDGKPAKTRILLDELNQTVKTKEPLRIGSGGGPTSRFDGLIDEVRAYDECLVDDDVAVLGTAETVAEIAALSANRRTPQQAIKLRSHFLEKVAPEAMREARRVLRKLVWERARMIEGFPTTMVMVEMQPARATHVLIRGAYDKPGERVQPGVPSALSPLPAGDSNNRLRLARWLVDPANPLTARVAVNRFWQMYFGTGLVKTPDDFGSQAEPPSHPTLLDWLATEFVRSGWDVKDLQRLIVTSATYRQSSKASAALLQHDPENRLLTRGPRFRLPAEMIRDQALAASGLLVERLGGPSVRPYQPAGLWRELTGTVEYVQGKGEDLYRRSLYTFWKRTVAPPAMMTFDASGREFCVVRESRTNTPLQALNLMNDVTFVEAARHLAERALLQGGSNPTERLTHAFRLVLSRRPTTTELGVLNEALQKHTATYRSRPDAARKLVAVGESKRNEAIEVCELAAYTAVAAMLLNLDEAITKE